MHGLSTTSRACSPGWSAANPDHGTFERYYGDFDFFIPPWWSQTREPWERAARIAAAEPPPGRECFIHRDYHPGNTLWHAGRLTGVVDWTSASWGSPAVDTAHMRWNLAVAHGVEAADGFLDHYHALSGAQPDQGYWDVVILLDVIPELKPHDVPATWKLERLDEYLASVLDRAS